MNFFDSSDDKLMLEESSSIRLDTLHQMEESAFGDYNFNAKRKEFYHLLSPSNPSASVYMYTYDETTYFFILEGAEIAGGLKAIHDDNGSVDINKLYILPQYREEGVASSLLEVMEYVYRGNLIKVDLDPKEVLLTKGFEVISSSNEKEQIKVNKDIAQKRGYSIDGSIAIKQG